MSFSFGIPETFEPTIMLPEDKSTWLPNMAACDNILALYQAMDKDPSLQLAVCFDPQVPIEAIAYVQFLAKHTSLSLIFTWKDGSWEGWKEALRMTIQESLKKYSIEPPPENASLEALFTFLDGIAYNGLCAPYLLSGLAVGYSNLNDRGRFHADLGRYTLLYSFGYPATWRLPMGTTPDNAQVENIVATPPHAVVLHRNVGVDTPYETSPLPSEEKHYHAAPVSLDRRASFVLASAV